MTRAIAVPARPHKTLTRDTPNAVANPISRISTSRTHGGSAVRNREAVWGVATAFSII